MLELQSYGCVFVDGQGAWALLEGLGELRQPPFDGKEIAPTVWQHEDIAISMPSSDPPPETIAVDRAVRVYFDGGCPPSTSLGSGGCLVFDPSGKLLRAAAYFYGRDAPTNNTAEAVAMVDVLRLVESMAWKREYSGVIVMGDSCLCIAFMQHRARPGK